MKRYGLLLTTVGMLLLTGWVLHKTNRFSRDAAPARSSHAKIANPLETPTGRRYRQNQPHHWRYCLLQN
ncbi:MAG TPA: hypothetical protein VN688_18265 [Gemmataceae bacterium]|nr:hypothetical protein [Gemmataceae bacterium]